MCLTKRNAQKINKGEITIWRGLDVRIFTFLLKELLTRAVFIFTYLRTGQFSVTFRSSSFSYRVKNADPLLISVAALVHCLLLFFCLHERASLQVKRVNSLFSCPFDPEPTGQTDRSTHMTNTAQLQV